MTATADGLVAVVLPSPAVAGRDVFRRFWPYARPYRAWLVVLLALVAVGPGVEAATLWLLKLLVDEVVVPRQATAFPPLALASLGLGALGAGIGFADNYLSSWVAERFVFDLRTGVFQHVQGLSLDFFERRRLGDLLARLTEDVDAIESLVLSGVVDAVAYLARLVYFTAALLYLQWDLAVLSLLVAPLFWLGARRFAAAIKRAAREKRRVAGALASLAEESLSNAALVQAYNQQAAEVERFRAQGRDAFRAAMRTARLRALFSPLVDLAQVVGVLAAVALGTWELAHDRTTLGTLLVFVAYLSQLYGPVRGLSRLGGTLATAAAAAERIVELLDQRPAVPEPRQARERGRAAGHVVFERVSFSYPGAPREALHDVSFAAEPGETVALVGPSGAGKSTLGKLLLRFYDPDGGRILIDGDDLRDLRLRSLRENVAILLQETLVFDGSVRDNIAYARPTASDAEIVAAAQAADAHEFISALPDGYATRVGQKGRRLSGGQRQRIAIARAMLRRAPILLLDEPMTGLDVEAGQRLLEPLRRLMLGHTTLVISHSLAIAREATRVVVLDQGRVVETGSHAALLERDGLYARLYRVHQGPPASLPALA